MTIEQAKHEIISVFNEAGKGVHLWLEHLERDEIDKLLEVAAIVKGAKERAHGGTARRGEPKRGGKDDRESERLIVPAKRGNRPEGPRGGK